MEYRTIAEGHAKSFRFQTGSIRREYRTIAEGHAKSFRFQTGSIRRSLTLLICYIFTSFNSKLVRLEGTGQMATLDVKTIGFQFQTGSIRRYVRLRNEC